MPTPVACGTPHHGVTGDVKGGKVSQATDKLVDGVFRSWQSNYAVSVKCIGETGVGCHTGWLSHCQYLIRWMAVPCGDLHVTCA